jgi:hypothetical protein
MAESWAVIGVSAKSPEASREFRIFDPIAKMDLHKSDRTFDPIAKEMEMRDNSLPPVEIVI